MLHSVCLTANLNWGFELQKVGLAHEDLLRREAQLPDLLLCQLDLFARAPVANIEQAVDDIIKKSLLLQ